MKRREFLKVVLFMLPYSLLEASIYVSPTGSHEIPFDSWGTASTSIQAAVEQAVDGDEVVVAGWEYLLSSSVKVLKGITVRSESGATNTIVNGQGVCRCFYVVHSNAVIDGFTITQGRGCYTEGQVEGGSQGGGMYIDQATVRNCVFQDNYACDIGGGVFASWATIQNCSFISNRAYYGAGVGGSNSIAQNCLVVRNEAWHGGGGISLAAASEVVNCTVCDNTAAEYGGGLYIYSENPNIQNTILYSNAAPVGPNYYGYYYQGSFYYSCTYPFTNGPGNISVDPGFVNASNSDYRLTAESPCVDAGTNVATAGATDVRGKARVFNARVDMGAFETTIQAAGVARTTNTELSWDTVPKARCQLQRCLDLASTNWVNVGNVITAADSRITMTDTNAPGGAGAYRLIWLKP